MQVRIEQSNIVDMIRECGYFCERVPETEVWYETDCPFEHLRLTTLPCGICLVLTGSTIMTDEACNQEWIDHRGKLAWFEKSHLPEIPPYHGHIALPYQEKPSSVNENGMLLPYPEMEV